MLISKLKQMFQDITVQKKAELIPEYYHNDLLLFTNGQVMNYQTFFELHQKSCQTAIIFEVEYDEETFVEKDNKLAGRIWITVQLPLQKVHKLEVMLIVHYQEGKIHRLWETTYPDWSALPEFQ
ncbi:MAG: nuclear transport factor 2 family protein [Gammaproteobacteria bacterium]